MSEILAVESTGKGKPTSITTGEGGDVSHCFEIRTANVDYFIGMFFACMHANIGNCILYCSIIIMLSIKLSHKTQF